MKKYSVSDIIKDYPLLRNTVAYLKRYSELNTPKEIRDSSIVGAIAPAVIMTPTEYVPASTSTINLGDSIVGLNESGSFPGQFDIIVINNPSGGVTAYDVSGVTELVISGSTGNDGTYVVAEGFDDGYQVTFRITTALADSTVDGAAAFDLDVAVPSYIVVTNNAENTAAIGVLSVNPLFSIAGSDTNDGDYTYDSNVDDGASYKIYVQEATDFDIQATEQGQMFDMGSLVDIVVEHSLDSNFIQINVFNVTSNTQYDSVGYFVTKTDSNTITLNVINLAASEGDEIHTFVKRLD